MVTADDVVHGKPTPEPYLQGAGLLGAAPSDCLVFEDTPAGIASAHAAGMRVIALGNTYPAHELGEADAIVASLAQVEVELGETKIIVKLAAMPVQKT
jgi:sugar-phosphatase